MYYRQIMLGSHPVRILGKCYGLNGGEWKKCWNHLNDTTTNPSAKTQSLPILCIHAEGFPKHHMWMLQTSAISSGRQVGVAGWSFRARASYSLIRGEQPAGSCFHAWVGTMRLTSDWKIFLFLFRDQEYDLTSPHGFSSCSCFFMGVITSWMCN